ncbi:MAG: mercuric transporter MerT family protein [Gemmatimonadota bacterium]
MADLTGNQRSDSKKSLFAAIGALGAAFLASLCCVGPLLFVTFGVGAGLASTFEPLRPIFSVVTALLIGVGFYIVYGRNRAAIACACEPAEELARTHKRRRDKAILWTATVLALVVWSFAYWSRFFV